MTINTHSLLLTGGKGGCLFTGSWRGPCGTNFTSAQRLTPWSRVLLGKLTGSLCWVRVYSLSYASFNSHAQYCHLWSVRLYQIFAHDLTEGINIINRLTPNDPYMGRTAPLTSKRCILYIYSTNICTEYFKHVLYSPFFFSSKFSLFHNANLFGSCIIHILYTGRAKIKKK